MGSHPEISEPEKELIVMKRVTYRVTATFNNEVDKAEAKRMMERALSRWPFDRSYPFIQVMQIDDIGEEKP